jgi:hypothetical protein
MNFELFLFCGGVAMDQEGRPKPLMKLHDGRSLIAHFLSFFTAQNGNPPKKITLLCDDGQKTLYEAELKKTQVLCSIAIQECGKNSTTFEKFSCALRALDMEHVRSFIHFSYPDIFFFGESSEPSISSLESETALIISAAPLTSRFPRLSIDPYSNEVKGISNYNSPVPANPMHVFGGDIWGRAEKLIELIGEFSAQHAETLKPSLEYDFFFWLVNEKKVRCVMKHGERLLVDSFRDVQKLMTLLNYSNL